MKKALLATAACAALGLASAAQAAVTVSFISKGAPTNGANTAVGYTGYVIRLVSSSGNIGGVDLESGTNGIKGTMVQRWNSPDVDGNYTTKTVTGTAQNATNSASNFDSHLLGIPGGYIGSIGFNEDPGAPFPPSGSGVGSGFPVNSDGAGISLGGPNGFIKGAYGVDGAFQSNTLDIAYVVVPNTATDLGHGLVVAGGVTIPVEFIIPEPGTLTLAGLAAMGLMSRRRRA